MNVRTLIATALFCVFALPAVAKDAAGVVHHESAPSQLNGEKAYLLFESSRAKSGMMRISHVLMRIPTENEVAAYRTAKEAAYQRALPKLIKKAKEETIPTIDEFQFSYEGPDNVFAIEMGKSLEKSDVFLVEVPAGTYVLYGISVGTADLTTCNCLGTVKFDAPSGVITHVGNLFADKVHKTSDVPHLEDNLGKSMFQYGFILGQALVPPKAGSPIPESLARFPLEVARFQPVASFREPGAESINRLAPIPGILEYDRGRVILPETALD